MCSLWNGFSIYRSLAVSLGQRWRSCPAKKKYKNKNTRALPLVLASVGVVAQQKKIKQKKTGALPLLLTSLA